MRIGVVGDIHGNYPGLEEAFRRMGRVDQLLFTGDGVGEIRRLQEISGVAVRGVRGNCDFLSAFPDHDLFCLDQYQIFLTHGHFYGVKSDLTRLGLTGQEKGVHLIVFGHTHLPLVSEWNGIMLLNPGTLCRERAYCGMSYGLIEVDEKGLHPGLCRL